MAHRKPFATNTKMKVDCCGYLSRITTSKVWRNWWLLKKNKANRVTIHPQTINFPKQYEGKKVRIKIEVIKRMINYDPISITNPLVILTIIIIAIIIMLVCFYILPEKILPEKKECPLCKGTRYINKKVKPK